MHNKIGTAKRLQSQRFSEQYVLNDSKKHNENVSYHDYFKESFFCKVALLMVYLERTLKRKQVAQRATIAHLRTSNYFQIVLK